MTSNQIAAASVRETTRHNEVYETETSRHNTAMEDIERQKNEAERLYRDRALDLQNQWETNRLQWSKAEGQAKLDLEAQANGIKQQMADNDAWYKQEMTVYNTSALQVDRNYKEAMASVSEYNAELQAKRDYYQNQKTEAETNNILAQIGLNRRKLRIEEQRIQNEYELGTLTLEQRDKELSLKRDEFNEQIRQYEDTLRDLNAASTKAKKSEAIRNYGAAISGVFNTASGIASIFGMR